MKKEKLEKIIGGVTFFSLFLPVVSLKKNHSCMIEDCFRLFYKGNIGICVEKTIDNLCMFIAIAWVFIVMGGAIIWNKNTHAICPFTIMASVIALTVYIALIDPSKWSLAISLVISFIIVVVAVVCDIKLLKRKS